MKLQRFVAVGLCVASSLGSQLPVFVGEAGAQVPTAQPPPALSGVLVGDKGEVRASQRVRLRNVDTGAVTGESVSDANGAYSFTLQQPGRYVVEVLDAAGSVLAVSSVVTSTTFPLIAGIVIPTAVVPAGGFFTSTAFLILAAAASAGTVVAVAGGGGGAGPAPVSPEQ